MEPVYRPVVGLILALYKLMGWKVDVRGAEHVPGHGPAVIASNHVGYLDFTFIGYGTRPRGRLVRFLAKQEVFDHWMIGPLMRGMHHIPVDRFGRASKALDDAIVALRRGELIGMFPEGTISRSFVPAGAKNGAARMAMGAGAPLIPCAVWGSQRLLTKGKPRNFQRGVAISVSFGEPVAYRRGDDPTDVTVRLMAAVTALVEDAARAYPQAPGSDADRWWLPAHLGGTAPTPEEAETLAGLERAERRRRRRERRRAPH